MSVKALTFLLTAAVLICGTTMSLSAQAITDEEGDVGVGTNEPHPSALLDLSSTTKGLLIPRMTSAQRDAIPDPAVGLLVFNTDNGTFEFNSGTPEQPSWTQIGGSNAWLLGGNAGTNSSTDFLGTTDNQALSIRTNNTNRILVGSDGHTVPGADNTYDLGSSQVRWRAGHFGPGSLHVHSTSSEADSAHDWSIGIIGSGSGQGGLQIAEDDNGVMTMNSQGNTGFGTPAPNVRTDVDGGLAVRPDDNDSVTSNSTTITVGNRTYLRVHSNASPFSREITLTDGLQDGQVVVLQVRGECDPQSETSDGVAVQDDNVAFEDGDTFVPLWNNNTLTLIWDDQQELWIELSRVQYFCPFEGQGA